VDGWELAQSHPARPRFEYVKFPPVPFTMLIASHFWADVCEVGLTTQVGSLVHCWIEFR
jgi:hypothetical protein